MVDDIHSFKECWYFNFIVAGQSVSVVGLAAMMQSNQTEAPLVLYPKFVFLFV